MPSAPTSPPLSPAAGASTPHSDGSHPAIAAPAAIRATGLTKRYGNRAAVDGIDLEIPAGVIAGFVGPNGSGKTTTIRMLLSLVAPTSGTGEVLGVPIDRPGEYLPRVGALIEAPAFYAPLSGRRNLEVLAALDGTPRSRIDEVLDLVELRDRAGDKVRGYSLGMKQRLGIAAALLPRPELLILDEPTNGLDPAGILDMRRLLARLRADGATVFISSHLLSELEQIVDWMVVLKEGKLLFHGAVDDLLRRRRTTLALGTERPDQVAPLAVHLATRGFQTTRQGDHLVLEADLDVAADINRAAFEAGIVLREITPTRATLEGTFMAMTGEEIA